MGRNSAFSFNFGELKRGTQLKECVASEDGTDENTIRSQGFLDLYKSAWQIVDPVKAKAGHYCFLGVPWDYIKQSLFVRNKPLDLDLKL